MSDPASSRKIGAGSGSGDGANPYEQQTSSTGVNEGRLTIVKFPSPAKFGLIWAAVAAAMLKKIAIP
jgi:hypothetical protein